ncbi:MAG: ATP-binding protein [Acidimicrobiales bacterium]
MQDHPTGTVTFLFTDVEGSTTLWEQHPQIMGSALQRHDTIVRAAIERQRGYVFATTGDGFAAAFWRPGDAMAAALEAQRTLQAEPWPGGATIRVRMGIHTGVAQERDGDYFGPALNRAARLMGVAHGGQVLLSLAVEELARDELPAGVRVASLGEHRLRGLSRPELIFELRADDLAGGFPPLRSSSAGVGNLPTPATSFVGRRHEVHDVAAALGVRRLVTLVGPGGVGKTRLTIEIAAALQAEFPDGAWFVELAPLAEGSAVEHAVAAVLGCTAEPGSTPRQSIVNALAGLRTLVIIDNCEHVTAAVADLVAALGRGAPSVAVLATSREPLRVPGEQIWPVGPLDPALDAAELFIERARTADPGFDVSDAARPRLIELCARLDGIPLAIELAAARVRASSLTDIAERLGDRFRLLRTPPARGGANPSPGRRHETLHATIEWSYRLLSEDEQRLFDRLSVFAGSFDHGAAEQICGGDGIDRADVVDRLDGLIDRSMVQTERVGDGLRLRLLETLRVFGAEGLAARGLTSALGDRHLTHYLDVARQARDWWEGERFDAGRDLFRREWDNLRAALDHAEATNDQQRASAIVTATFWYCWTGVIEEHQRWTARRLAALTAPDPLVLAAAAAWDLALTGDTRSAAELGRRAVEAVPRGDHNAAAVAWWAVCGAAWYGGRKDEALIADAEAKQAAAAGSINFPNAFIAGFIHPIAATEPERAPGVVAHARARFAPLHNTAVDAMLTGHSGLAAWAVGERQLALQEWRHSLARASAAGLRSIEAGTLGFLAVRAADAGETDPPRLFHDALVRMHEVRVTNYQYWLLSAIAHWWATHGRVPDAARVIGYLDRHDPEGNQMVADLRAEATALVAAEPTGPRLGAEGAAMTNNELIQFCLEALSATPPAS